MGSQACSTVLIRRAPVSVPPAAADAQPGEVADVGVAFVEQGREVADAEVRIVGRFAAHLGAQAQVAAHQRRDGGPLGRVDVVETAAVEDHRAVRVAR